MTTSFDVGHLVWAKIQGVPWWPGQLMDPLDAPKDVQQKQRAGWRLVSFFGDNKWAFSQDQRMVDFEPHIEQYEQQKGCNKMKTWRLGVEEAKELAARRAGRPPLTDHKPLDFITKKAAKLAAALAGVAFSPTPSSNPASRELTMARQRNVRSPGAASPARNGSLGHALTGGNHILGGGPKLSEQAVSGAAATPPKRHLKVPADSAAAATFTFAGNGASYANASNFYNSSNGTSNGNCNGNQPGAKPVQLLVPSFKTSGPGGGGGGGGAAVLPPQHGDATASVSLSSHAAAALAAPGYIKTMLLAGGSFAEKVGHPASGLLSNGNGHPTATPRRGGTSRAIELARNHVAATAAAASSNGGVHGGGVRKQTKVVSPGPRLSVAFAALAAAASNGGASAAATSATIAAQRATAHAPSTAAPGSNSSPAASPSLPSTSPPAAGVTSHGRAAAAGVAAAIALVAPSQNRSNQHSHTAGYPNCTNQTTVPWMEYLQLTSALPSDIQAVGAKASLAWLKDFARGGGGGVMAQPMSARKQLLSFDLSKRVAHMWKLSGGKLGAVTKSPRKAALNHTARVALPSKLVTDHDHRGVGPAVPAYGPAGAPCMNVVLSINNQVLPFLCYANIHYSNIASRETTQHQLVGLTGALQCYSHTTKYIDAWELLAPGLVLMSLHMPPGESTGTPLSISPTGLVLSAASKQQQQPWLGSAPVPLAAASSKSSGGGLAAQLLHVHSGAGTAAAAGAARGGAPRRSAAIAAASVVAAASQPRGGGASAFEHDDSDYDDYGNDVVGGASSAAEANGLKRVRSEASKALGRPPGTARKEDEVKRSHKAARLSTGGALVTNMRRLVGSGARDQLLAKKPNQEHLPGAGVGSHISPNIIPSNTPSAIRGLAVQVISGMDPPTGAQESSRRAKAPAPLSSLLPLSRQSSHPSSAAAAAGYISHFGGTRLLATGGGLRLQHADFSQPTSHAPGSSTHTPHASKQQRVTQYSSGQQQGHLPSHASTPPPSFYSTPAGGGSSSGYHTTGGSGFGSGLINSGSMDPAQQYDRVQQYPSHPSHQQQPQLHSTHSLHTQTQQQQQQRHTAQQPGSLMYSEALPEIPFLYPDLDSDMPGGEVSFGPGSDDEDNLDPSQNPNRHPPHQSTPQLPSNQTTQHGSRQAMSGQQTGSRKNSLDPADPTGWAKAPLGEGSMSHMIPNQWGTINGGGGAGGLVQTGGSGGQPRPAHSEPHSRRVQGSRGKAGQPQRAYETEDVQAGRGGVQLPGCESYKMRVNTAANKVITRAVQSASLRSEAKQCFIQISRDLIQVALSLREDTCKSLDIAALAHRLIGSALSDGLDLRNDDRWAFIALATDLLQ